MFRWLERQPKSLQSSTPCRLQLMRLEERKVLNADPLLAELSELFDGGDANDQPVVEQEVQDRQAEEFDAYKSDRFEERETNDRQDQPPRQERQEQRKRELAKSMVDGQESRQQQANPPQQNETTEPRPTNRNESQPVDNGDSTDTPDTRDEQDDVAQSPRVQARRAEKSSVEDHDETTRDETTHEDEPTDTDINEDDRGSTDDTTPDTGNDHVVVRDRTHGETGDTDPSDDPQNDGDERNEEEDDPAGAVPVTSPDSPRGETDKPDSHQPGRDTSRADGGRRHDREAGQIVYAKASVPTGRAEAQHDGTQQSQAVTADSSVASEYGPTERVQSSTSTLGKGALLMVSLSKPLSRLTIADDRDLDNQHDDGAGLPKTLPKVDGKKRNRKDNDQQKNRSTLAKHRAQQRRVAVQRTRPNLTPKQRDQLAAQLASFAEPKEATQGTSASQQTDNHEGVTVVATGGIAVGSSVMFIQHCRSAAQSRQSSSRPTLPQYTGTTIANE